MLDQPIQHIDPLLQVAQIVEATEAEGPGIRFALWFQGCPLRCPGCCNPEMLPFSGGQPLHVSQAVRRVKSATEKKDVEGVTLLGGEPFAHAEGAAMLARRVREMGLSVMVFSGYTLDEIRSFDDPHAAALLEQIDILVDGPYLRNLPETQRRWIGSKNQQIHFLSERYQADDPQWRRPNTIEVRMKDGEIYVNGFPAKNAVGLWKRPNRKKNKQNPKFE